MRLIFALKNLLPIIGQGIQFFGGRLEFLGGFHPVLARSIFFQVVRLIAPYSVPVLKWIRSALRNSTSLRMA